MNIIKKNCKEKWNQLTAWILPVMSTPVSFFTVSGKLPMISRTWQIIKDQFSKVRLKRFLSIILNSFWLIWCVVDETLNKIRLENPLVTNTCYNDEMDMTFISSNCCLMFILSLLFLTPTSPVSLLAPTGPSPVETIVTLINARFTFS